MYILYRGGPRKLLRNRVVTNLNNILKNCMELIRNGLIGAIMVQIALKLWAQWTQWTTRTYNSGTESGSFRT